jgi:hypothetical protein
MYKDSTSKKLIDIIGNVKLDIVQKSYLLFKEIDSLDPQNQIQAIRTIFECYGLTPRHETSIEVVQFDKEDVDAAYEKHKEKLEYNMKGWFEINKDLPLNNTISEICYYFQNIIDFNEKVIVFAKLLSSKYIPVNVNFFSAHVDNESDNLILREYASEYIQMRQMLNLNIGPTSRGSLLLDFLKPLQDNPDKQSVVLGAFIEEMVRRLRNKPATPQIQGKSESNFNFPFNIQGMNMGGDPEQLREMMKKMQSILPPEVLDQLKNLFSDLDKDDDSENDIK